MDILDKSRDGTVIPHLVAGVIAATDLQAARRFYEDFLGLDCVQPGDDRLLVRDLFGKAAMEAGHDDFFVLDVRRATKVENPQRMLHHWGLDVSSTEAVDRMHAEAQSQRAEHALGRITPISQLHGAHSFYFADSDSNWWEIEYRLDGSSNEDFFRRGDMGRGEATGEAPSPAVRPMAEPRSGSALQAAELTHGTCEQLDLDASRLFLEATLGLRCVRHLEPAQLFAGRGTFAVFAIRQPRVRPQTTANRWVLAFPSAADVLAIRERAVRNREAQGIQSVGEISRLDGESAFTLEDADGNWWEVCDRDLTAYRRMFEQGDISVTATT
jgi:catechol 2,3-dioxygenase-like lactoylglutathione lyase family enzyme